MTVITRVMQGPALRLVLSNAARRNPLSVAAIEELEAGVEYARSTASVRAVVLSSEGPVFSAGHDLREMRTLTADQQYELLARCARLMVSLQKLDVPVLAAVRGLAAAAGCQLVAACDMAVAGPEARFSLPGAAVGLFCITPSVPVTRTISAKAAAFMLYTGKPIDAHQALAYGLVSHRADSERALDELVENIVADIASKPRDVIAHGKRYLTRQTTAAETERYRVAVDAMHENLQLDNAREGLESFVEKRHPVWK